MRALSPYGTQKPLSGEVGKRSVLEDVEIPCIYRIFKKEQVVEQILCPGRNSLNYAFLIDKPAWKVTSFMKENTLPGGCRCLKT